MSPDWSAKTAPIPYAKLGNPQSLNLYAYVYNNPLSRADADGHTATCGTGSGQAQCAADLNKLAPGTKVAKDGTVSKGNLFQRALNHLDGNGAGQSLVSNIVDSSKLTTITTQAGTAVNGGGSQLGGQVTYDPKGADGLVYAKNGDIVPGHLSGPTVLGHELIHQEHENDGTKDNSAASRYLETGGLVYMEPGTVEEFRTVGLGNFNNSGDITEHDIANQLGDPLRATVAPASQLIPQ